MLFVQLAFIGSDAARAWQQIAFLQQCQELEGNARWWHYLNLLDIQCDHKVGAVALHTCVAEVFDSHFVLVLQAFQSERRDLNYIRRLVPQLIQKSNFDLYTVLDFTRHYQIEDSCSSLLYVEALLLRPSDTSVDYQSQIVGVLEDIHQHQVRACTVVVCRGLAGGAHNVVCVVLIS